MNYGFWETENENCARTWEGSKWQLVTNRRILDRHIPDMKLAHLIVWSLGIHVLYISGFIVSRNYQLSPDPPNLWFQDLDIVVHFSVFASYLRGFPVSTGKWHVRFWCSNLGLSEWVPEMGHELVVITCHIHVYPLRVVCQDLANSWSDLDPISGGFWSRFIEYKIMHNL